MLTQHGLVMPWKDPFHRDDKDIMVWEDRFLVGRYRVHFLPTHPKGPQVYFRYWTGKLTPTVVEKDPMSEVVRKTRELIRPVKKIRMSAAGVIIPSDKSSLVTCNIEIEKIIKKYVSELNQEKEEFRLRIKSQGLNCEYVAQIQKINIKEVEKKRWFSRKKVKEYEPIMNIMYSGHRPNIGIYYARKWKIDAKDLEERIGKDAKSIEADLNKL